MPSKGADEAADTVITCVNVYQNEPSPFIPFIVYRITARLNK